MRNYDGMFCFNQFTHQMNSCNKFTVTCKTIQEKLKCLPVKLNMSVNRLDLIFKSIGESLDI